MNRRNFLKLGALLVPAAIVEPRRVYSFIWAKRSASRISKTEGFYVQNPIMLNGVPFPGGDILIDADGNIRHVHVDIGKLIAERLERRRQQMQEAVREVMIELSVQA
jgi:hypothetical protein